MPTSIGMTWEAIGIRYKRRSGSFGQMALMRLVCFAMPLFAAQTVVAMETCRYSGTTSYAGTATVETKAAKVNGETTVDVAARVNARSLGFLDWQYLYEEIGTWRGGEIQRIGVNHRYSFAGFVRRQLWDVFDRTPAGLTAYRVQANSLADIQEKHPGFAEHWSMERFGQPWLADYASARPERRADLDLPAAEMPAGIGTPLTLGFFWVRWSGLSARTVPVFLPGFKHNIRVDVQVAPVGTEANGLLHVRSTVRHPQLSETQVSTGDAWISPDHRLVRVTFDARTDRASAVGELRADGCTGTP
jgi:hypothetical protein